ncbi:MAG: penicillin-binding protein 2 [Candidatus Omnitrophota bacterium]
MRGRIYLTVISICFFILFFGIFYLQIIRWPLYQVLSQKNHIRLVPLDGLRGTIYDRNGIPIVDNRLSFDVIVFPQEIKDEDKTFARIAKVIGTPKENIEAIVRQEYQAPFAPITIARDIDKETAFVLEEMKQDIPGVLVRPKALRWYIYNERASHITGYLSLINKEELERLRDYGYSVRDLVGRSGVERIYDRYLKGEGGGMQLEVDAIGRLVKTLGTKTPKKGKDITLTIDAKLQSYVSECLAGRKGAIVVMNPNNGEILAMSSSPPYDPNIFIEPNKNEAAMGLLRSGAHPMINRAINGQYPPGSTFKIIIALAGLETKKINENTTFNCGGKFWVGNIEFDCWRGEGHGPQNLREGLIHSCNIYFYNLGRKLGPDILAEYAHKLGLGRPSGIDLAGEGKGFVPTVWWKKTAKGENWYEGETVNYSIGQGYLSVTPLQMTEVISIFATEGNIPRPHLIKKLGDLEIIAPKPRTINISKDAFNIIKQALRQVVDSDTGTGQRARVEGLKFAAKTGTAQNPQGEAHAWFIGYAPADNPKIAFVILVEHGGKGGLVAAELAKQILEFVRNNTDILKDG